MSARILQWLFPCFLSRKPDKVCFHAPCILHWLFRLILAGIFIYGGYVKLESPLLCEAFLYTYDLFPNAYVPAMARYFPWPEMVLGLLLLNGFGRKVRYLAIVSILLLLFFIVILAVTYLRGIEADCGCFGFDDPISPKSIARDSLMLIPALYLVFAGPLLRRRLQNKLPESRSS